MEDKVQEEKADKLVALIESAKEENKIDLGKIRKIGIFVPIVFITGVVLLLGYIWWPQYETEVFKTSEITTFLGEDGGSFGNIIKPDPKEDNQKSEKMQSETEIQSLKEIEILKRRMDSVSRKYEQTLHGQNLEIQDLRSKLDAIRLANEEVDNEGAQQLFEKRVRSSLRALSDRSEDNGSTESAHHSDENQNFLSQNELFFRARSKPATMERAKIIANPSNTILQGTIMQASLETAINTDLPGAIRAVISDDVHSLDGRRILIPRGSKVLGRYSDNINLGQKRVMVIWERILLPDNQTVTINSYGADAIGQSGVRGKVDTHFFERFGSAALISVINIAPSVAVSSLPYRRNRSYSEEEILANSISQNMQSGLGGIIGEHLNRSPTIGIHQGANITIFVDRDLEIL